MVDNDRNLHKALVCVVCDVEITGTERVCHVSRDKLLKNKDRLSPQRYNENFGGELDPLLVKQYEVDDMPGLLLSPRSSKNQKDKYVACSQCYLSLSNRNCENENPPKHAIANGLAIGYIPKILDIQMPDGAWIKDTTVKKDTRGNIIDDLLTPVVCSAIAPVRPHAYIFSYSGGAISPSEEIINSLRPIRRKY